MSTQAVTEEPVVTSTSIHAEPTSVTIHAEPVPPAVHVEPFPPEETRLAAGTEAAQEPPRSRLPSNAPDIPKVAYEVPPETGLILVETSHESRPVDTTVDETKPPRPRRTRPPRVEISEEPLQIVETAHKDSRNPET